MSGVFGILDSRRAQPLAAVLAQMGRCMAHRPWFQVETLCDEAAGVGLGRLGIGLFNAAPQPVQDEAGTVAVFLRGEFSNAGAVRRALQADGVQLRDDSDPELALRLYQRRGPHFAAELQGAFLLAVWDRRRQTVLVANDRHGLYPLYYAHAHGRLVFAPELKGVLCDPAVRPVLDETALAEYLRFQLLLGAKTFFEGVQLLPNAALLEFNLRDGALTLTPYWDFSRLPAEPAAIDFATAVREAGARLKTAVDRLSATSLRLGMYLSGGLDSRVILGLLEPDRLPITTLTYGHPQSRDVIYAGRLAARAGTRHHFSAVTDGTWVPAHADFHLTLTEGFHSWIHAHGISLLPQARDLMDVNLTGLHGAELNWEDPALYAAPDELAYLGRLYRALLHDTTWPSLDEADEAELYAPAVAGRLRGRAYESLRAEVQRVAHLSYHQRTIHFSFQADRRLYQYYTVFNRSHLEQRYPFFDDAYLDFVYALPPAFLFKRKLRRAVIVDRLPHLASIPYDKDDLPVTGSETTQRLAALLHRAEHFVNHHLPRPLFPEYGSLYMDYESWLRGDLRAWGQALLFGEALRRRGLLAPAFLESLWRRQMSGLEPNMIGKIAPIMTLELLLRRFCDAA